MKFITPAPARGPNHGQARAVKAAAIEKELSRYVRLVCGHLTTYEEIVRTRIWQPSKGKEYCCTCGKWVKREIHKKPVDPDPEGLFPPF